ncbi:MAG: hypothetical protein F6J98_38900 [Moorea sp. SIO4G2]|nr:hypothetical protein [Moorena sp. SIO4G2]
MNTTLKPLSRKPIGDRLLVFEVVITSLKALLGMGCGQTGVDKRVSGKIYFNQFKGFRFEEHSI